MGAGSKKIAWGFVFGGILAIILGILFIVFPYGSVAFLGILAGAILIVMGVSSIVNAAGGWGLVHNAGWLLAGGILDAILGIMFIVAPLSGGWVLSIFLGIGIIVMAVLTLVGGGAVSRAFSTGIFVFDIIWSILFLIIGIWMLADPAMMSMLFGFFAIAEGIRLTIAGFAH